MRRFTALALVVAFAVVVSPAPLVVAQGQTGGVNGTAVDPSKNPLANHTVRLRNVKTGEITSVTQSTANGSFSFAGISPGDFVIEIVGPGNAGIIATSSAITVTAGTVATVTVTATALAAVGAAAAGAGGLAALFTDTSLLVVAAAGIVGVVIAVKATQDDASPSR